MAKSWTVFLFALLLPCLAEAGTARGMVRTSTGRGYWIYTAEGDVAAFGDAEFHGSMKGATLYAPISGMTARPHDDGYWLAGEDGAVISFGMAQSCGSMSGTPLNKPIVGITAALNGNGYIL